MADAPFVYVTYIKTTPERLWEALTTSAFTEKYWSGTRIQSDWRVGSPVQLIDHEGQVSDTGEVLAADRPRRLSYSWRVDFHEELKKEGASRVTFELEPADDTVKLTVTHDQFVDNSKVRIGVSTGWPQILASLKSLLETGSALELTSVATLKREKEKAIARMLEGNR
jgi:uncharacterized protein YndB with AHSA1/START domain